MKILQIPHGWNKGRIVSDICPTITISSWEANNFLVYEDTASDTEGMDRSAGGRCV